MTEPPAAWGKSWGLNRSLRLCISYVPCGYYPRFYSPICHPCICQYPTALAMDRHQEIPGANCSEQCDTGWRHLPGEEDSMPPLGAESLLPPAIAWGRCCLSLKGIKQVQRYNIDPEFPQLFNRWWDPLIVLLVQGML